MIKLTDATYEELYVLNAAVERALRGTLYKRTEATLQIWRTQILTAMQIVKDRETTNQN